MKCEFRKCLSLNLPLQETTGRTDGRVLIYYCKKQRYCLATCYYFYNAKIYVDEVFGFLLVILKKK